MIQVPSVQDPYRMAQMAPQMQNPMPMPVMPQQAQADYNAVKIAINGASVNAPNAQQPAYAAPTMPYYSYPQANLYNYPQATQQPYYQPVAQQPVVAHTPVALPQAPVTEAPKQPVVHPQVVQQNINAPAAVAVPEPVVNHAVVAKDAKKAVDNTKNADKTAKVDVKAPKELKPQVDVNAFIAELTNPDFEKQAKSMENIATMVNKEPQKATELLDERVVKSLNDILTKDTKNMVGPTKEQMEARQKIMSGKQVSDSEKELANKMTPKEQAERNKSYALFTMAIMQKLFGDEVEKLSGQVVPITELPGSVSVVEQLKSNPNPMVRASAIESLSYIQRPEYKNDLNTIFTIAKNDQDKNVQETATAALEKLNKA